MHPTDLELIRFARLTKSQRAPNDPVAVHLVGCDVCREEFALMEEWLTDPNTQNQGLSGRSAFEETVLHLLRRRASSVPLSLLEMPQNVAGGYVLAADGVAVSAAGLQHRATLYSEDPEVILRVMHDPKAGRDLLQLTADDPADIDPHSGEKKSGEKKSGDSKKPKSDEKKD